MSSTQIKKTTGTGSSNCAKWSESEETTLVDTLVAEVCRGRRTESGFKASSFILVQDEIQRQHGTALEVQQIKNKYSAIKKDYNIFTTLLKQSGFGWDNELLIATAADDVWERYLVAHPQAKKFRKHPLHNYQKLQELFLGVPATGNHALTPGNLSSSQLPTIDKPKPVTKTSTSEPEQQKTDHENLEFTVKLEDNTTSNTKPLPPKRTYCESDLENPNPAPDAKAQRVRKTTGKIVADALLNVGKTTEKLGVSKTERAIQILQEDYSDTFTEEEMVDAMEVFKNLRKSEMFIAMQKVKVRDSWLKKQI